MTPLQIKALKRYWWIIVFTPVISGFVGKYLSPTGTAQTTGTSQAENIVSFTLVGVVLGVFIVCLICQPSDVGNNEFKQPENLKDSPKKISLTMQVFLFCMLCLVVIGIFILIM